MMRWLGLVFMATDPSDETQTSYLKVQEAEQRPRRPKTPSMRRRAEPKIEFST
jgi:hypothetical protein